MGMRTLVVARDGAFYDHPEWPVSRTFWQGDQQGLLVADNQTRSYANGSYDRRRLLSAFAWGPEAAPTPPPESPVASTSMPPPELLTPAPNSRPRHPREGPDR